MAAPFLPLFLPSTVVPFVRPICVQQMGSAEVLARSPGDGGTKNPGVSCRSVWLQQKGSEIFVLLWLTVKSIWYLYEAMNWWKPGGHLSKRVLRYSLQGWGYRHTLWHFLKNANSVMLLLLFLFSVIPQLIPVSQHFLHLGLHSTSHLERLDLTHCEV